jgi:putative oxidoreductase
LVHGYGKISVGPTPGFLKAFVDLGFAPPAPYFWTTLFVETLAGIGLILGLFTRFFAVAAAIELLVITITYWHTGFSWLRQGYEYTLLWGLMCAAIALRGGGPYSVDRLIGKEL